MSGRFVIEQLTGPKRRLELLDGCLPFKGYGIGGVQASAKERNPGNPYAVQHVYGPDEDDTEVTGYWTDAFMDNNVLDSSRISALVDGEAIGNIRDLIAIVNLMWTEGQEVEVRWLHTIRRGIIKAFHAKFLDEDRADWDMKFEWNSPSNLTGNKARAVPINVDVDEVAADMTSRASRLATRAHRPYASDSTVNDQIAEAVTQVGTSATDLDNTASAFFSATGALDGPRRAAAILSAIESQAEVVVTLANGRPDRMDYALLDPAAMSLGEVLLAAKMNRGMCREARAMRGAAARQRYAMVSQFNPELLDILQVSENDDTRRVCVRYYGTDDGAYDLARYNGLRDSKLVAGQVIFIPRELPSATTRRS